MSDLIQKVYNKILEIQFKINITKNTSSINYQLKKDSVTISTEGQQKLQKILSLKKRIEHGDYEIPDASLDKIAESIAKTLLISNNHQDTNQ